MMTQLLYAVAVGMTLASVAFLIGLSDGATSLLYVIGMGTTLLVRCQGALAGEMTSATEHPILS